MSPATSIPTKAFGRTGHESTRIIFGAAALGGMSQDRADATMAMVRQAGVNHIDTAASYGESETRLKPFLADHRDDYFLATKTGLRDGAEARAQLETSLERMGVDQVDMIQLHNLVEPDEWDAAFAAGGAVEALAQARDEGLTRFIGVTGHGVRIPGMHVRSLGEFDFDAVLFPYNFTMLDNPAYRHDVEELLALCAAKNVAAQTIKSLAKGRWPADYEGRRFTWYEPLSDPDAITRAVGHVLQDDRVFLNTTSDAAKLPTIFAAAGAFARGELTVTDAELEADTVAQGITPLFDGGERERITRADIPW